MPRSLSLVLLFVIAPFVGGLAAAEPAELAALRAKAEKGNALAQYNLGLAYAEGTLVPADIPEAFVWLSLASANGNMGKALDRVLENITDEQLAEGRRRLADYRNALAAHATVPVLSPGTVRKPAPRGFSLAANPPASPPEPVHDTLVTCLPAADTGREPTRPDQPPVDEVAQLRSENARLKADLARAQYQLRDQGVALARLQQEAASRGSLSTLPVDARRTSPPDSAPARPANP